MLLRHDRDDPIRWQWKRTQIGTHVVAVDNGGIEFARRHPRLPLTGRNADNLDAGKAIRRGEQRTRHAESQRSGRLGTVAGGAPGCVLRDDQRTRRRQEPRARGGEHRGAPRAIEQRRTHLAFEARDLLTHGRLHDTEAICGGRECSGVGHRQEVADLSELHGQTGTRPDRFIANSDDTYPFLIVVDDDVSRCDRCMPTFDTPDARLHYTDTHHPGTSSPPTTGEDPPALVLVHGFLMSTRVWDLLTPLLAGTHRVVALDLRGHGRSEIGESCTLDDSVADVHALIEHLGLVNPVVVGSSVGAAIALELARRHPAQLSRAVLIGCLVYGTAEPGPFADAMRVMVTGLGADPETTAREAVPSWFGPLGGPVAAQWALRIAAGTDPTAVGLADDVLGWDPRPYLAEVDVPLRYLHGTHDPIPRALMAHAGALTPGVALIDVDGAGHLPHVEMPARLGALVTMAELP